MKTIAKDGVTLTDDQKATIREILKARKVADSIVVSLPKSLRDPLGISEGDRLMISLDSRKRRLVITKE